MMLTLHLAWGQASQACTTSWAGIGLYLRAMKYKWVHKSSLVQDGVDVPSQLCITTALASG